MDEGIFSDSKLEVRKVESDEEESDFECYDTSDGKPVHVDVQEEVAVKKPILALLPNRSDEDAFIKNESTRKEQPEPWLMSMEEIESDQAPNEDDDDYKNR